MRVGPLEEVTGGVGASWVMLRRVSGEGTGDKKRRGKRYNKERCGGEMCRIVEKPGMGKELEEGQVGRPMAPASSVATQEHQWLACE